MAKSITKDILGNPESVEYSREEIKILIKGISSKESLVRLCKEINASIISLDIEELRKKSYIDTFMFCLTGNTKSKNIVLKLSDVKLINSWKKHLDNLKDKSFKLIGTFDHAFIEQGKLAEYKNEIFNICQQDSKFLKILPNQAKFRIEVSLDEEIILKITLGYASKRVYIVKYDKSGEFVEYLSNVHILVSTANKKVQRSGKNNKISNDFEKIVINYFNEKGIIRNLDFEKPIKIGNILDYIQNPPMGLKSLEVNYESGIPGLGSIPLNFQDYSQALKILKENNFKITIDLLKNKPKKLKTKNLLFFVGNQPFFNNY